MVTGFEGGLLQRYNAMQPHREQSMTLNRGLAEVMHWEERDRQREVTSKSVGLLGPHATWPSNSGWVTAEHSKERNVMFTHSHAPTRTDTNTHTPPHTD